MYWDVWRGYTYNALMWTLCGLTIAMARIEAAERAAVAPVIVPKRRVA